MTDILPTVKIKADTAKGFRIINASDFDPARHERFVEAPAVPELPPLPPVLGAPPGPLDNLGANWRDGDAADLKRLAAVVGDGRAVDNKRQAIEVIDAALKARASA